MRLNGSNWRFLTAERAGAGDERLNEGASHAGTRDVLLAADETFLLLPGSSSPGRHSDETAWKGIVPWPRPAVMSCSDRTLDDRTAGPFPQGTQELAKEPTNETPG